MAWREVRRNCREIQVRSAIYYLFFRLPVSLFLASFPARRYIPASRTVCRFLWQEDETVKGSIQKAKADETDVARLAKLASIAGTPGLEEYVVIGMMRRLHEVPIFYFILLFIRAN